MTQGSQDTRFIPFLMELLSLVARWLNPELSDRVVAVFAGDFILNVTRAQPDAAEPGPDDTQKTLTRPPGAAEQCGSGGYSNPLRESIHHDSSL